LSASKVADTSQMKSLVWTGSFLSHYLS